MTAMDALPALLLAAVSAGVVRGFSGFGSAMLFVPIASAAVEPRQAVVLLFVIDGIISVPLLPGGWRHCNWREVAPLSLGAALTVPLGGYLLVSVDPTALRWALATLALGAVAVLSSGWRYRRIPGTGLSAAVGMSSGLLGGMASFYGPPIVLFWLGGLSSGRTVRANVIVYFAAMTVVAGITYAAYGILQLAVLQQVLVLLPVYGAAVWLGARLFPHASEQVFRRIAYAVIAAAAVLSSPAFDGTF